MSARSIRRGGAGGRRHQYRQGDEIETLEPIDLPATGCYFCLLPERTWEYPTDDAVMGGRVIRGPWYACDTCARFINADDQYNLISRMVVRKLAKVYRGRRTHGDLPRALAQALAETAARTFFQARYGEPKRVG